MFYWTSSIEHRPYVDEVVTRQCDQHTTSSDLWYILLCGRLSLLVANSRLSCTATRDTSRSYIIPSTFSTLFCYSGWSQIVQVIRSFIARATDYRMTLVRWKHRAGLSAITGLPCLSPGCAWGGWVVEQVRGVDMDWSNKGVTCGEGHTPNEIFRRPFWAYF